MKKEDLLKQIADTAYNIGFGAKKHFATYDLVCKAPNLIGFLSLATGCFALFVDVLATKQMSAILIVLGVSVLFINLYENKKRQYEEVGKKLTQLFNDLKKLYYDVKEAESDDLEAKIEGLKGIETVYYSVSISKQIMFSDWYAHYKFFWQHQIDWIEEQRPFKFWRDKVPLSFCVTLAIFLIAILFVIFKK